MKKTLSLSVAVLATLFLAGCWDTGGGEKIGSITRLNRQGIFCKTWEAEIIRGGMNSGSGVIGQAFHFTIEDDSLAKEVTKYMNSQQEVKITYKREGVTWCRSDSDDVFLSKIEPLNAVSLTTPARVETESSSSSIANAMSTTNQDHMTTTTIDNTSNNTITIQPLYEQILRVIKRQQDQLDQNQKLMQRLFEERNKK